MDPFKKKDPQVEADTLREVVRDSLNKRKKPVKFTFEGCHIFKGLNLCLSTRFTVMCKSDKLNFKYLHM